MEKGGNMKVVHLSLVDFWEQGLLAYRIHKGVEKEGVESLFVTFLKSSGDPSVKAIIKDPVFKDKIKLVENMPYNIAPPLIEIFEDWRNKLGVKIMPYEGEITYSLPYSNIDLGNLDCINEADIIHIHWVPGLVDWELAPLFFLGKQVVITMYDLSFFTGGCDLPIAIDCKGYLKGCIKCPEVMEDAQALISDAWQKKRELFKLMNFKIVVQSTFLKNMIEKMGIKDVELIFPSSPFLDYKPITKSKARDILGIEQNKNVIITVVPSVENKRKGIKNIIEAINILIEREEVHNPYFILIGADYLDLDIHVTFPIHHVPIMPNEEILSWYYRASDVYVSGAIYDPINLYSLDAMAMGVPVVGFSETALEDYVNHKKTGYIAEKNNIDDLAEGIKFIFQKKNRSKAIQRQVKSTIKKEFSLDGQAKKYVNLYQSLLKQKQRIEIDRLIKWGEKFFKKGRKDIATRIFEKLLEKDNLNPLLLNNIGVTYWENRQYFKALEYFKQAHKINPHDKDIKENMIKAQSAIGLDKLGGNL